MPLQLVGAPPDVLAPLGQNWGLGAFSPVALRRHGFQAYLEMLRSAFRHAGGVRIDHVLGLTRMWPTPDGFSATIAQAGNGNSAGIYQH